MTLKPPVRIAVTGAAGQIAYATLFRIAGGIMLGRDQPVILQLLDLPQAQQALRGVIMEMQDCAFPLLADIFATDDPEVAFKDADIALLIGARPRTQGMERADLLHANGEIFKVQGAALNKVAHRNVKVLVVGNPANTNAYIAMKSAPDIPAGKLHRSDGASRPPPRRQPNCRKNQPPDYFHRANVRLGQPQPDHVRRLPLRHQQRRVRPRHD